MNNWKHNHILDLSTYSLDDYKTVLELTTRFKDVHKSSTRKLPALQGRLITNLFFEPVQELVQALKLLRRDYLLIYKIFLYLQVL